MAKVSNGNGASVSTVTESVSDSTTVFDEQGKLKVNGDCPATETTTKKTKQKPAKQKSEVTAQAEGLHKTFLKELGNTFGEKKSDGFYTIQRKDGKYSAIFVRDKSHLSVASRLFGDNVARTATTEAEAKKLAKTLVTAIQKREKEN